jgi:hypothetical protein
MDFDAPNTIKWEVPLISQAIVILDGSLDLQLNEEPLLR